MKPKLKQLLIEIPLTIIYCFVFLSIFFGLLLLEGVILSQLDFSVIGDIRKIELIFASIGLVSLAFFLPVYIGITLANKLYRLIKSLF